MKLRKTLGAASALLFFGLLSAPSVLAQDEYEIRSSVAKKLGDEIAKYFKYLDDGNLGVADQQLKVVDEQVADLAKKWRMEPATSDSALKAIGAFDEVLMNHLVSKWEGRFKKGRFEAGETPDGMGFHLYLPKSFQSRPRSLEEFLPLIVDLRPADEKDAEDYFEKHWKSQPVLETAALLLPEPPPSGDWYSDEGIASTLQPIGYLAWDQVPIHADRIFLCGSGKSAPATARLAARFTEPLAGLILRSGGSADEFLAANVSRIAVFAADESPLVKAVQSQQEARVTREKPEGEALASWIESTRRVRYPDQVSGVVPELSWGGATWLKVSQIGDVDAADPATYAQFKASIDREANKIAITSKRVTQYYVRLNDKVLDLDKEVVIEVNGNELFNEKVNRNVGRLLETAFYTGDRGRLWVRIVEINVPIEASTTEPNGKGDEKTGGDQDADGEERAEDPEKK